MYVSDPDDLTGESRLPGLLHVPLGENHGVVPGMPELLDFSRTLGDRPHIAGQGDLPHETNALPDGPVLEARGDGHGHGKVGRGLLDLEPPGNIDEDVEGAQLLPPVLLQHGNDEDQPVQVQPVGHPPGIREAGEGDQGLHLEEDGPGPFQCRGHGVPRGNGEKGVQEYPVLVADLLEPPVRHPEKAHLVDGPVPVLEGPEEPELLPVVPLEIEHRVNKVLQELGARDAPVLGDMPDEHHGDPRLLGVLRELHGRLPDLPHGAGNTGDLGGIDGLDGVHDEALVTPLLPVIGHFDDVLHRRAGGNGYGIAADSEPARPSC